MSLSLLISLKNKRTAHTHTHTYRQDKIKNEVFFQFLIFWVLHKHSFTRRSLLSHYIIHETNNVLALLFRVQRLKQKTFREKHHLLCILEVRVCPRFVKSGVRLGEKGK